MTKIEILGINMTRRPNWDRPTCIFAFGDVALPDLQTTLRGCALAKSHGRIVAMPPKLAGAHPGDLAAVQWSQSSPFAVAVKDKLMAAFTAMGGTVPETKEPQRRDHVTGQPIGADPFERHDEEASDHEAVAGLARTLSVERAEVRRVLG